MEYYLYEYFVIQVQIRILRSLSENSELVYLCIQYDSTVASSVHACVSRFLVRALSHVGASERKPQWPVPQATLCSRVLSMLAETGETCGPKNGTPEEEREEQNLDSRAARGAESEKLTPALRRSPRKSSLLTRRPASICTATLRT